MTPSFGPVFDLPHPADFFTATCRAAPTAELHSNTYPDENPQTQRKYRDDEMQQVVRALAFDFPLLIARFAVAALVVDVGHFKFPNGDCPQT